MQALQPDLSGVGLKACDEVLKLQLSLNVFENKRLASFFVHFQELNREVKFEEVLVDENKLSRVVVAKVLVACLLFSLRDWK